MDKAVRSAVLRILASMTDGEFRAIATEARGGDTWTPGPSDYRQLVSELEGQTRDEVKDAANQGLRDYLQGQGG